MPPPNRTRPQPAVVLLHCWLQANRTLAREILKLAKELSAPDPERWAAGVLAAHAQQGGAPEAEQVLRAAQRLALAQQLASPTAVPVLSVKTIRELASQVRRLDPAKNGDPSPAQALWRDALPVLSDTGLVQDGQLKSEAIPKLTAARQVLAQEVGQPLESIPPATAALQVLSEYWTARVTEDRAAFDKAHAAQAAVTKAMAPWRARAIHQEKTKTSATDAANPLVQAFIAQLNPQVRQGFEMRLIGGPPLSDVVSLEAKRGGALSVERIDRAIKAVQPEPLPPMPPASARPVAVDVDANEFYGLY